MSEVKEITVNVDEFLAIDKYCLLYTSDVYKRQVQDFRHLNEGELRGGRERPFVDRQERTGGERA